MESTLIFSGIMLDNYEKIEQKIKENAKVLIYLDFSNNILSDFNLKLNLQSLQILIIDHNKLYSLKNFPILKNLDTLSVNDNQFSEAKDFVSHCSEKFPVLKLLNTMRNPMNPSFERYDEYKRYKVLLKKLKTVEILDGLPINDDSMLEYYKQSTKQSQNQQQQTSNSKQAEETKKQEEEDEEAYEENDKVKELDNADDAADLQNIIKQKKRQSTITYSQRMLKKADNLTKFNRKNHSEGNKHISNNDL